MQAKQKLFYLFIVLFVFSIILAGDSVYIKVRICPVFSNPDASSQRLFMLKQGQKVDVLKKESNWLHISVNNQKGYIQPFFTSTSPNLKRISRADDLKSTSHIATRKRASSYTSSAAAARGLMSEDIRERENVAFKNFDFESIKWLENFSYSDEDILTFAKQEGIFN